MASVTLSKAEMLTLWKQRRHLAPLRADCIIARSDGVDVDSMCIADMRAWYLDLLRYGPRELLAPEDIARRSSCVVAPDGVAEIPLEADVVRVLSVRLSGWTAEATVETDPHAAAARLQRNPFSRGGACWPVAVSVAGSGVLRVYGPVVRAGTPVDLLEAVIDPGPERYILDEAALGCLCCDFYNDNSHRYK